MNLVYTDVNSYKAFTKYSQKTNPKQTSIYLVEYNLSFRGTNDWIKENEILY